MPWEHYRRAGLADSCARSTKDTSIRRAECESSNIPRGTLDIAAPARRLTRDDIAAPARSATVQGIAATEGRATEHDIAVTEGRLTLSDTPAMEGHN
jgi:hypothetical protein